MYNIVTFLPKFFYNILYLKHVININNYVMSKPFGSGLKTRRFAES